MPPRGRMPHLHTTSVLRVIRTSKVARTPRATVARNVLRHCASIPQPPLDLLSPNGAISGQEAKRRFGGQPHCAPAPGTGHTSPHRTGDTMRKRLAALLPVLVAAALSTGCAGASAPTSPASQPDETADLASVRKEIASDGAV